MQIGTVLIACLLYLGSGRRIQTIGQVESGAEFEPFKPFAAVNGRRNSVIAIGTFADKQKSDDDQRNSMVMEPTLGDMHKTSEDGIRIGIGT